MFGSIHVRCDTKESSLRFILQSVFLGFSLRLLVDHSLLTTCQHRSTTHITVAEQLVRNLVGNKVSLYWN